MHRVGVGDGGVPLKLTFCKVEPLKLAPGRIEPLKLAPAIVAPSKTAPDRMTLLKLT